MLRHNPIGESAGLVPEARWQIRQRERFKGRGDLIFHHSLGKFGPAMRSSLLNRSLVSLNSCVFQNTCPPSDPTMNVDGYSRRRRQGEADTPFPD